MELKLTTPRLRVACSTDRASQVPLFNFCLVGLLCASDPVGRHLSSPECKYSLDHYSYAFFFLLLASVSLYIPKPCVPRCIFLKLIYLFSVNSTPNMGLEFKTLRCSSHRASQMSPRFIFYLIFYTTFLVVTTTDIHMTPKLWPSFP